MPTDRYAHQFDSGETHRLLLLCKECGCAVVVSEDHDKFHDRIDQLERRLEVHSGEQGQWRHNR